MGRIFSQLGKGSAERQPPLAPAVPEVGKQVADEAFVQDKVYSLLMQNGGSMHKMFGIRANPANEAGKQVLTELTHTVSAVLNNQPIIQSPKPVIDPPEESTSTPNFSR